MLSDSKALDNVDVICFTYDSADPDSFAFIADIRDRFPHINLIPTIYAATKADLDKQEQRYYVQPDTYTRQLGLQPPIHVSALWGATGDLFVQLAEGASWLGAAVPRYTFSFSYVSVTHTLDPRTKKIGCGEEQIHDCCLLPLPLVV